MLEVTSGSPASDGGDVIAAHVALLIPLVVGLMVWVGAAGLALAAEPLQTSDDYLYTDPLYGYRLMVPAGWYIYPTPPDALYGAAVLANYDLEAAETGGVPPGGVKLQIGVAPLPAGQSLDDWTAKWIDFEANNEAVRDFPVTATAPQRVRLSGTMEATSFGIAGGPEPVPVNVLAVASGDQVVVAGISPADSPAAKQAESLLGGLQVAPAHVFPAEVIGMALKRAAAPRPLTANRRADVSAAGTCPSGTFPGDEAANAPIELYMPFTSGETWHPGGAGSFYGNGYHCNSYNDYYATDWNMDGDDFGRVVLPVADGAISTAQTPSCPTTGFGCYVQVAHAASIRTLYGHLSGVIRTSGSVSHTNRIGTVGSTGNSTGNHLHLRFQKNDGGYYSRCYNNGGSCPNGETGASPQSPRPSPMNTASGYQTLRDGDSYTSNNPADEVADHEVYLPLVVYEDP